MSIRSSPLFEVYAAGTRWRRKLETLVRDAASGSVTLANALASPALPERETLLRAIEAAGLPIHVYYVSEASTSGYAVPCLSWHDAFADLQVLTSFTRSHHQTIATLLGGSAPSPEEVQIGAVYLDLLEEHSRLPEFEGRGYRLLWKSDPIPHGGAILSSRLPTRKRRACEEGIAAYFEAVRAGTLTSPPMGDVARLDQCARGNFDRLERTLANHPALATYLPDLAPFAARLSRPP